MKPLYPVAICGCIAALGLAHAVAALMPIAWTADGSDPAPKVITIGQGETRPLIATLRNYGAPVVIPATATAELYYQTNGMGSLYWSGGPATVTTGGVITATWSPALDAGARQYTFALGVDNNGARLYTAYGLIRMRTTPGAIVNALPLPAPSIDFATLDIRNAPWATPADLDTALEGVVTEETDLIAIAQLDAHKVANNPHNVTPAQIGAITTNQLNAVLEGIDVEESDPIAYPVATNALATATNALAVAEGALQAEATNYLASAVAHAQSAHGLTDNGGFAGGDGATATDGGAVGQSAYAGDGGAVGAYASAQYGGAVGDYASAQYGGAVGASAYAGDGGAVGAYASAQYGGAVGASAYAGDGGAVGAYASAQYGGAVGAGAYATDGGAVGRAATSTDGGAVGYEARTSSGFAGGYRAMAALDNTGYGQPIDAIQLGTGWNPDANTLQIYDYKLMNADGSIPAERMASALSGYATTGAVAAVQAEVATLAEETLDPWIDWSAVITPVNGTATVTRATGAEPMLTLTDDVVISVPTDNWPTTGVSRVSLSLKAGTHSVTLLTDTVEYSSTPTISTDDWTTILFRRTGDQAKWQGVGL